MSRINKESTYGELTFCSTHGDAVFRIGLLYPNNRSVSHLFQSGKLAKTL